MLILASGDQSIDRHALVSRHNVILTEINHERPLQVGNGEFAFGMDITGLQTFVPFNTMSQWGWHSSALPPQLKLEDYKGQVWQTHGRPIRYPMPDPDQPELSAWMAGNPHRINLGRLGFTLRMRDGTVARAEDLKNTRQQLDLWNGIVTSRFELDGQPVTVKTACHPTTDAVAVQVDSPLLRMGRLSVFLDCPGNNPLQFANFVGDWSHPAAFEEKSSGPHRVDLVRRLDHDTYFVSLSWKGDAELKRPGSEPALPLTIIKAEYGAGDKWLDITDLATRSVHDGRLLMHVSNDLGPDPALGQVKRARIRYRSGGKEQTIEAGENEDLLIDPSPDRRRVTLRPGSTESLSFVCSFSPRPLNPTLPDAQATFAACQQKWPAYWSCGGAIDLSLSADPRWKELERRIVLSQYLMKVNEAGSLPPQESGLVNNGWFGRFHLEMTWWHAAHWALWNRWSELNRCMGLYERLLANSKKLAVSQGYKGARWPKCIGPDLREWPHEIHGLLIWQQPHPIFFAELDYRAHPTQATLKKWWPVVEATGDFLASYAFLDPLSKKFVLGPPVIVASENNPPKTTQNPTFELGYWRFGLRTAKQWRKRMGLATNLEWDRVLRDLSPLPQEDGLYVLYEGVKDMWTAYNFEHPALTGTFGMLPGDGIDKPTMARTLAKIGATWDFNRTWGWDFPMLAMCAARLGQPDKAVDFLMTSASGFQFDERGLATGGPFPYFPSNGGLLYAVAMMVAGWDGAPKRNAPGFPSRWNVRWEGLSQAP
jgi:hypothetical protein